MLKRFFRESLFQTVVGVAVTATITVFATVYKYWNWPNAIVGSVLLFSGALYLMDRLGIGYSTKSRVRDWLDHSGYGIKTIQDSNEFHFVMTDNIGMNTDIIQVKPDGQISIVSGQHKATHTQMANFKKLSPSEQAAFWKNVRLELLRYGVNYSDLKLDDTGVAFSESIVDSRSLTGADFLRKVMFVRSAGRLYWELLVNLNETTTQ